MICVLVVHEHRLMGDLMATILEGSGGLRVIGYKATAEDALEFLETWPCDVVIASITYPRIQRCTWPAPSWDAATQPRC